MGPPPDQAPSSGEQATACRDSARLHHGAVSESQLASTPSTGGRPPAAPPARPGQTARHRNERYRARHRHAVWAAGTAFPDPGTRTGSGVSHKPDRVGQRLHRQPVRHRPRSRRLARFCTSTFSSSSQTCRMTFYPATELGYLACGKQPSVAVRVRRPLRCLPCVACKDLHHYARLQDPRVLRRNAALRATSCCAPLGNSRRAMRRKAPRPLINGRLAAGHHFGGRKRRHWVGVGSSGFIEESRTTESSGPPHQAPESSCKSAARRRCTSRHAQQPPLTSEGCRSHRRHDPEAQLSFSG